MALTSAVWGLVIALGGSSVVAWSAPIGQSEPDPAPRPGSATASAWPSGSRVSGVVQDVVVEPAPSRGGPSATVQRVLRTERGTTLLQPGALAGNRSGDEVTVTIGATQRPAAPAGSVAAGRAGPARPMVSVAAVRTRRVASTATTPGVRSLYVAMVVPKGGKPDPGYSPALIADTVRKASSYWSSQTGGQVSLKLVTTKGWWNSAYTCQDVFGMWDEMQAKIPESQGKNRHLVLVVPRESAVVDNCYYGFATIGSAGSGGAVFIADLNQSLLAHELGHNLGLHHANSLTCAARQDAPFGSGSGFGADCADRSYDDLLDVMGYSGPGFGEGNINGPHLDVMGLLPTAVRKIGTGTTTVKIRPLSATNAEDRVLRITDPTGVTYYAEYRTSSGLDAIPLQSVDRPSPGVRILRPDPRYRDGSGSYELDSTPTTAWDYERALAPGSSFTSASGRVRVTVTAQNEREATLVVSVSGSRLGAALGGAPRTVLAELPTKVGYGSSVTSRATVRDASGIAVAGWPVSVQRLAGRSAWRTVAAVTTDDKGVASATFTHEATGTYRWLSGATAGAEPVASRATTVTSVAVVSLDAPAAKLPLARATRLQGGLSAGPGALVQLQTSTAATGPWTNMAKATVDRARVSATLTPYRRGALWLRLVVMPGAGYLGAVSAARTTLVG